MRLPKGRPESTGSPVTSDAYSPRVASTYRSITSTQKFACTPNTCSSSPLRSFSASTQTQLLLLSSAPSLSPLRSFVRCHLPCSRVYCSRCCPPPSQFASVLVSLQSVKEDRRTINEDRICVFEEKTPQKQKTRIPQKQVRFRKRRCPRTEGRASQRREAAAAHFLLLLLTSNGRGFWISSTSDDAKEATASSVATGDTEDITTTTIAEEGGENEGEGEELRSFARWRWRYSSSRVGSR